MALEDSDPSAPPRPLPELTKSGDGDLVEIGQDDLVPREKRRLGDYLAYQTGQVHKNEFPIKPGSTPFRIRTATGNPAPISDTDDNAVRTYMDTFNEESGQKARSTFESLSDSGMLDTDTRFLIKKGKSDSSWHRTGTEIFREIDELRGEADVPKRVEEAMLANNRFNDTNRPFTPGQREGEGNSLGSLIVQPTLGAHVPQKFPRAVNGGEFATISIDKLKTFGILTMLEASGELNIPTDLSNPDEAFAAAISTSAPGLARLGQRIDTTRFDGVKILNTIEPSFTKVNRDFSPAGNAISSYGNVNSPLVPFNGLVATSSITSAALLSLAVSIMMKSLALLLQAPGASRTTTISRGGLGIAEVQGSTVDGLEARRRRLGSFLGKTDSTTAYRPIRDDITLDTVETQYPFYQCLDRGIDVFFDVENKPVGQAILGLTGTVIQSHGYYNVVFRNLVRSTSDLLLGLVKTGLNEKSSYDVDYNLGGSGSGATDAISNAIGFVQIMNQSKVLKFMNVLAMIGEATFLAEDTAALQIDNQPDEFDDPLESGEKIPSLEMLHQKNRLSDIFQNRLAWGGNTVKSLYLLPNILPLAAAIHDGNKARFSGMTPTNGFKKIDTKRIEPDDVVKMENYLEADYMPFYFHDLRTNEIIAFHAFLDSISDSYTVDYSESEGYGRIGKVLTYKNTQRSISLSFAVLATSEEDFNEMWYKVNKLITLLYPQYTQGRALTFGQDTFVQPFSQLPAASPMIRLRLGDIFKSNYNKFDLARIFGLASPDFRLQSQEAREADASQNRENLDRKIREITARMSRGEWHDGDEAKIVPWPSGGARSSGYQRDLTDAPARPTPEQRTAQRDLNTRGQLDVVISAGGGGVSRSLRTGGEGIRVRIKNPTQTEQGGYFIVPRDKLLLDTNFIHSLAVRQTPPTTSGDDPNAEAQRQARANFFSPDGTTPNPVFKSFESVRGRGLAGFIRSFNMDIDTSTQWETVGLNNRAPKMLRVSMQFEPIHDLPPGLDHNGFNSAPVYNVGSWIGQATRETSQTAVVGQPEASTPETAPVSPSAPDRPSLGGLGIGI
jgi:hypothetical protein